MKDNFLESDSFCAKRILLFGINRIQSHPTINHVKQIDAMSDQFLSTGIDEIHFVSICDFLLFDPIMIKLAPHVESTQLTDADEITTLQKLLSKKGTHRFLQEYWQFAAVVNKQQVEYYVDQPFTIKLGPDTRADIYSNIAPTKVLEWLTHKSI
jgi:peroxiredoxin